MKRLFIFVAAAALFAFSQFVFGSDLDDLKAANEQMMKAITDKDAAALAALIHPGAVNFESAFPMVAPEKDSVSALTKLYTPILASLEYLNVVPYNHQFKIVGNTGIVWGHNTVYSKNKGESVRTVHERMTVTWVKSGGKWLVLMAHSSPLPSE